jgi:hypothetical protein
VRQTLQGRQQPGIHGRLRRYSLHANLAAPWAPARGQ